MYKRQLERHALAENSEENIPKSIKPDFEAITKYQDSLYPVSYTHLDVYKRQE